MLRQVFILKEDDVIYQRQFANALTLREIQDMRFRIQSDARRKMGGSVGYFDYINYRISYDIEPELKLIFIYVTGLSDDFFRNIRTEIDNFKQEFLRLFKDHVGSGKLEKKELTPLDPILDEIHKNLRPKIAVVGWSGVGKTTIKTLIRRDEIPMQHIPTISCEIATIQIGKLQFQLFDFAGQDEFSFLWKGFIKGSDAVLIVTDSTPKNVEKSKHFKKLQETEVPSAYTAVVANKQDLKGAMSPSEVESVIGLKAYPMVANNPDNRANMVNIIAQILDMGTDENPLLDGAVEERKARKHVKPVIEKPSFKSVGSLMSSLGGKKDALNPQSEKTSGLESASPMEPCENPAMAEQKAKQLAKELMFQQELTEKDVSRLKLKDMNRKIMLLPVDISSAIMEELNKVDVEDRLKKHYDMIQSTIETIAQGTSFTFENFKKCFIDYCVKDSFSAPKMALKQFLESQFMLLETHVNKKEMEKIKAAKKVEDMNIIILAINCALLTKLNPEEYPDFKTIKERFGASITKTESLVDLEDYYERVLNKIA